MHDDLTERKNARIAHDFEKRKNEFRNWMIRELQTNKEEYEDCGEINHTHLVESCAEDCNFYENKYFDIPEQLFDLAVDVVSKFEEESEEE